MVIEIHILFLSDSDDTYILRKVAESVENDDINIDSEKENDVTNNPVESEEDDEQNVTSRYKSFICISCSFSNSRHFFI